MKNVLRLVFIVLLLFPFFGAWMPHGVAQTMHTEQEKHHSTAGYHEHAHDDPHGSAFHASHFDVTTYFSDYLHVELRDADDYSLEKPKPHSQPLYFTDLAPRALPHRTRYKTIPHTGPPPDNALAALSSLPVYLGTQRLRI